VAVLLLPLGSLAEHIYVERSGVPSLDAFVRFELPTTGYVCDVRGTELIQLANEYRRAASCDELPPVLRHAILASEGKNFFSHSGVDYSALPRVLQKTAQHSLASWWHGGALCLRLREGGPRSPSSWCAVTSCAT
jgi:membrane carboxypeptidase/penicillin-binding protein